MGHRNLLRPLAIRWALTLNCGGRRDTRTVDPRTLYKSKVEQFTDVKCEVKVLLSVHVAVCVADHG